MAKLTLTDIAAGYLSVSTYNANNTLLNAAVENTLSRDGTSPNTMEAQLDMNSQRLVNLPDAVANQEPITLSQAASIASVSVSLTQENVGAVLFPRTAAEVSASVTPTNYYHPEGNILRYGATGDGTTDDTTAIQNAINVQSYGNHNAVYFPGGVYVVSALYTYYDASLNTGYNNSGAGNQQRIRLVGVGRMTKANLQTTYADMANSTLGTVLKGSSATLSVINSSYVSGGSKQAGNIGIENMTIIASNNSWVVDFLNISNGAAVKQVLIGQYGTGGGMRWRSWFLSEMNDVHIVNKSGSVQNTGLYLFQDSGETDGSVMTLSQVRSEDFAYGQVIGGLDSAATLVSGRVIMDGCSTNSCTVGAFLGANLKTIHLRGCSYADGATSVGIMVGETCRTVMIESCRINAAIGIYLGKQLTTSATVSDVTINNNWITLSDALVTDAAYTYQTSGVGVWVGTAVSRVTLTNNDFTGENDSTTEQYCVYMEDTGANVNFWNGNTSSVLKTGNRVRDFTVYQDGNDNIDHMNIGGVTHAGRVAAPTAGTYNLGHLFWNNVPALTEQMGWICTVAGTSGALSSTTISTTSGSATVTVTAGDIPGDGTYINITGVTGTKKVLKHTAASTLVLDSTCDATVVSGSTANQAFTFEDIGAQIA
jgi:hypothetical protein